MFYSCETTFFRGVPLPELDFYDPQLPFVNKYVSRLYLPKSNRNQKLWRITKSGKIHGYIYGAIHGKNVLMPSQIKFLIDETTKLISEAALETIMNVFKKRNTKAMGDEYELLTHFYSNEKQVYELESPEDNFAIKDKIDLCKKDRICSLRSTPILCELLASDNLNLHEKEELLTVQTNLMGMYELDRERERKWWETTIVPQLCTGISTIQVGAGHLPYVIKMLASDNYTVEQLSF